MADNLRERVEFLLEQMSFEEVLYENDVSEVEAILWLIETGYITFPEIFRDEQFKLENINPEDEEDGEDLQ